MCLTFCFYACQVRDTGLQFLKPICFLLLVQIILIGIFYAMIFPSKIGTYINSKANDTYISAISPALTALSNVQNSTIAQIFEVRQDLEILSTSFQIQDSIVNNLKLNITDLDKQFTGIVLNEFHFNSYSFSGIGSVSYEIGYITLSKSNSRKMVMCSIAGALSSWASPFIEGSISINFMMDGIKAYSSFIPVKLYEFSVLINMPFPSISAGEKLVLRFSIENNPARFEMELYYVTCSQFW